MDKLTVFTNQHAPASRFGDIRVGWTVRVHQKLKEKDKAKNQIFEGIVISRKHGNEAGATITVRKSAGGYGVEKTIPLRLPSIEKIEVVKKSRVRRAKLGYLREKSQKEIRRKTKQIEAIEKQAEAAPEAPEQDSQE